MTRLKKIISFSLWGNNPKYVNGAIRNAELSQIIYPDWECRFYIGQSTLSVAVNEMSQLRHMQNVEIIEMAEEGDWTGMFWRFLPCSDPDVDIMISRDCDSRLSLREKIAVDDWLSSVKSFHIMRDHPHHDAKILGGMWGTKTDILRDMFGLITDYGKKNYWQIDQEFLAEVIFPRIKNDCKIHDEIFDGKKFPSSRNKFEFVGEVYDENNLRNYEHIEILKTYLKVNRKWYNIFR